MLQCGQARLILLLKVSKTGVAQQAAGADAAFGGAAQPPAVRQAFSKLNSRKWLLKLHERGIR